MNISEITGKQWKAIAASVLLILGWILVPQYLQRFHGISAVQVSFAITVAYYIGFRLWKRGIKGSK
jgi:hypothetical protein